jgi:hypothetical protein
MSDGPRSPKCPYCKAHVTLPVTYYSGDEGIRQFLDQERESVNCTTCGSPLEVDLPCAVSCERWIGIVLANPQPYPVILAGALVEQILRGRRSDSSTAEAYLIVVGRSDQLKRILSLTSTQWFNAVRFDRLVGRAWWGELEALRILVDACLKADQAERAYWLIVETVGWANELYLCPDIYRMLCAIAEQSGDRIAPGLKERRSAIDDFRRVREILDPMRTPVPDWYERAYLGFFDGDNLFRPEPWEPHLILVEQVRFCHERQPDFEGAERHIDLYPIQAIAQPLPTLLERLMIQMCVIGLTPGIQDLLSTLDPKDARALQSFKDLFRARWEIITASDRYELYKKYREVSGGRDLVMDFGLSPQGIYFTIDRMESGRDPRF